MTVTDELDKLIREIVEPAARELLQIVADSYDEEKNPAIRPIKESTFKVKKPFKVTTK